MKKILHVIASPRGEASYSQKLANALIDKLKTEYPGSGILAKNLNREVYEHLQLAHASAFVIAPEKQDAGQAAISLHSNETVAELLDADILVISTPMYNFSIPSSLKAWLDHITRSGLTFRFSAEGPEGLVTGKKIYVAIASGGVYSEGVMKEFDFIEPYLKSVLAFIGLTDINFLRVEGISIPGIQETALEKAISDIKL
jgi:FMN-dependent NADH-azoreductase